MKFRALLFDLDDTLVVDEAVSKETFACVAELARSSHGAEKEKFIRDAMKHARALWAAGPCHPLCRSLGISAFECLWGKFDTPGEQWLQLRTWALEFREQVFDAALRDQMIDSPTGSQDLAEAWAAERRLLQRLMPDAKEVLARLGADYKIGLLTNGAPDLQREKIAASGLGSAFQAIAISGEYNIGKPRPEIFHRLAAELGTAPAECLMVGNSVERDIAGARNAGILSVWIKVPGSEEPDTAEPDATITALAELPGVVSSLESRLDA